MSPPDTDVRVTTSFHKFSNFLLEWSFLDDIPRCRYECCVAAEEFFT